jgi:hypothetical protein
MCSISVINIDEAGHYKSCLVKAEKYLIEVYRYIQLNPVRAMMVEELRVCLVKLSNQRIGQNIGFVYSAS